MLQYIGLLPLDAPYVLTNIDEILHGEGINRTRFLTESGTVILGISKLHANEIADKDAGKMYEVSKANHETAPLYPTATLPLKDNYPMSSSSVGPAIAPAPVANPVIIKDQNGLVVLGPDNTVATCPFCNACIKTAVKYTMTTRTHIAAALYTLLCCCCCIAYCSESAKNADHYCPNCQRYLGTYQK